MTFPSTGDRPDEMALFFRAGKEQEVPLHVLFAMTDPAIVEKIRKRLILNGTMASMGMHVPNEIDAVAARVAAYMGWIEEPKP